MNTDTHISLSLSSLLTLERGKYSLHQDLSRELPVDFITSIKRFGVLHPPLVSKNNKGYTVVCGCRRIQALSEIGGITAVACRVIEQSGPSDLLAVILEDQQLYGPLSVIMITRFYKLVDSLVPKSSGKKLFGQFNIGSYDHIRRYLPLLKLEQPIIDDIHLGRISDKVALFLCSITPQDRIFLCNLFRRLSLNKNRQRRLLEMARIIIAQRGGTYRTLFEKEYPDVLDTHDQSNIPQRVAQLFRVLHEASHPLSCEAEQNFKIMTANLNLPARCTLSHSHSFETDSVTLSIDFETFNQMVESWARIKHHFE